jgi:hypothetical protein
MKSSDLVCDDRSIVKTAATRGYHQLGGILRQPWAARDREKANGPAGVLISRHQSRTQYRYEGEVRRRRSIAPACGSQVQSKSVRRGDLICEGRARIITRDLTVSRARAANNLIIGSLPERFIDR